MAHPAADDMATPHPPLGTPTVQALPVTPGKVAMWLFLATEVMFFTGLIGTYIVLRAGSPATAYPNIFSPATNVANLVDFHGVVVEKLGDAKAAEALIKTATGKSDADVEAMMKSHPVVVPGMMPAKAEKLAEDLKSAGSVAEAQPLKGMAWPEPYDHERNPLSIDLTAINTFFLICSSVTMVLGLGAFQRDDRRAGTRYLLATTLIGAVFVSIQAVEYYQLMMGHHYPIGVSADGHFRPNSSLFASCFFTMTGFHGAHVFAGVVMLAVLTINGARGRYTKAHHSPVELIGLYWHFVDLVWIILFTVVYLV